VVKLHFNTTEEFEGLFKTKTLSVTRAIVKGIEEAMTKNRRSADLFQISFDDYERMYDISLPVSQWVDALENCLDHLHEVGSADEQIDCWKLLEAAKAW